MSTNVLLVFNRNPYDDAQESKMLDWAQWIKEADKIISF